MADEYSQKFQFEYKTNSNLVLTADRSLIDRRSKDEPTGEVLPIKEIDSRSMGSRVRKNEEDNLKEVAKKKPRTEKNQTFISDDSQLFSDKKKLNYYPSTETFEPVYAALMSIIDNLVPNGTEYLMFITDEILKELKKTDCNNDVRKSNVQELVPGKLTSETFDNLIALSNKLTDYKFFKRGPSKNQNIEETNAVNVEFHDNVDDDNDDELQPEVQDSESDGDDLEPRTSVPLNMGDLPGHLTEVLGASTVLPQMGLNLNPNIKAEGIINPKDVDAFWLQRTLSQHYSDPRECQNITKECLEVLKNANSTNELENKLMKILKRDRFDLVRLLRNNRYTIYYCTKLQSAQTDVERIKIESEMKRDAKLKKILDDLRKNEIKTDMVSSEHSRRVNARTAKVQAEVESHEEVQAEYGDVEALDLKHLISNLGSHWNTNTKCHLPDGSYRKSRSGYNLVHVPAPRQKALEANESLVNVSELPGFCKAAFEKRTTLNRIQSKVYKTALETDENILLCAPTGAGKTDVALLCMMREIGKHINNDGTIRKDDFKIIYIAPMKSLVSEMATAFGERLKSYNLKVSMLSGDNNLTRQEIMETQVIVCTPEKWDIISIKSGERTYTQLVKLLIIDEIHLLHDDRGPVIEAIVARTVRSMEKGHSNLDMRIVGLSATLPNYNDVAAFIRVNKSKGLFKFDASYRPVPMEQEYLGVTEKSASKRVELINELVYEKVMEYAGKHQVLIFVHSRRDTAATAKGIKEKCLNKDTLGLFLRDKKASSVVLQQDLDKVKNHDLKDLLPYGFAIHHAGLNVYDRRFVEDLFTDKHIQVLVSTSTLAWGVNLPAHVVIIKGTQVYSPEKGQYTELSALDVMQMFGRAGRPQYDTKGVGIMITNDNELHYYLSLLNEQLPIESQFVRKLPDNLNSEIVTGSVRNIYEAIDWMTYSYLYIRMKQNPKEYSVESTIIEDPTLKKHLRNLIYTAAKILESAEMVKFEMRTGEFQSTELGRIAAHYYCTNETMFTLKKYLKKTMIDIDIFKVFSECSEFKQISVRLEEKAEIKKLLENVPIPISENEVDVKSKINCLLQAYISNLKLDRFTLASDASFISQSAARLMRAMFEISLHRRWSQLTKSILDTCKEIEHRMWTCSCPLRQFNKVKPEFITTLEKKSIPFEELLDYDQNEIGELLKNQKSGKSIYRYIHLIPKLQVSFHIQPITRSTMKVELTISADFEWWEKYHGSSQGFWIVVDDVNGENILHHEYFLLKQRFRDVEHILKFYVPIFEPMSPFYIIRVISDKWIGSESEFAVNLIELLLPEKNFPPTELLDLQRLPIKALRKEKYEEFYKDKMAFFNSIQTQCFESLYNTDDNVFLGTPTGCGKTVCAELAIMRLFTNRPDGRCVYVTAVEDVEQIRYAEWSQSFGKILGKTVVRLTGNPAVDGKSISKANIIVSTADKWDVLSRRWKQRKAVQNIQLFIADDLHLIGSHRFGTTLEVVCSRTRYMSSQLEAPIRIIGLSYSLTNARDVGEWLECHNTATLNFHPSVRHRPLNIDITTFNIAHNATRINAMMRPVYRTILQHAPSAPVIIFSPTMKKTEVIAFELMGLAIAEKRSFGSASETNIGESVKKISNDVLAESIGCGIGFIHEALSVQERNLILELFSRQIINVLVVSHSLCWSIPPLAHLVVVMDTQVYNGKDCTYDDYATVDLLQMIGRANHGAYEDARAVIMCQNTKEDYMKKFLFEPLPLESHLDHELHDHFNAEIVTKTIENKQDAVDYLTWTFLYYRMTKNPNYYKLKGVSHRFLSDHLSVLVENTLNDLEKSKCIAVKDEVDVSAINLGMIAAYYYIHYATIEMFSKSLRPNCKVRGLLELICGADEFEELPIRYGEDVVLGQIGQYSRYPLTAGRTLTDPKTKAEILLQAHLSRVPIKAAELRGDLTAILNRCVRLVQACVDVLSSNRWLRPALAAMELAQMLTQAQWSRDKLINQLPHIHDEPKLRERLETAKIDTVFDLLGLEHAERSSLLDGLSANRTKDVADFLIRYPSVDLKYEATRSVARGGKIQVSVQLERDSENVGPVISPRFPYQKEESWWLVLGDPTDDRLISIKLVSGSRPNDKMTLQFDAPEESGDYKYYLYFMSDSYLGCDQEYDFEVRVG